MQQEFYDTPEPTPIGGNPRSYGGYPSVADTSEFADNGGFMKWQINPSDVLTEIHWGLRGFVYDESKQRWMQIHKPEMSEEGIQAIISRLKWHINKNAVLTNLKDEEIQRITFEFGFSLVQLLKNNWERFGVERTKLTSIANDITDTVFYTLKRAKEGTFLKHLETVERVNTVMREGWGNPPRDDERAQNKFSLKRLFK